MNQSAPFYKKAGITTLLSLVVALAAWGDSRDTLKSIRAKKPAASKAGSKKPPIKKPVSRKPAARAAAVRKPAVPKRTTPASATRKPGAATAASVKPFPATRALPEDTLAQGRVAWWPMEGDARDLVGGNHGRLRRGVSAVQGVHGVALQFDGNQSGINIPDTLPLQFNDSFTISAWVTVLSYPPEGRICQIFFRGDSRAGLDPYSLHITPQGKLVFIIDGEKGARAGLDAPIPLRTAVHVSATLDTATQKMRIYVNGKLAAETSTPVRPFRELVPTERPGIAIGNTQSAGEHEQAFYGILDDLQVHNRALTLAEVARLAQP